VQLDLNAVAAALLDAAPDAILVVDDGEIVFANDEVERLFGYRREELVGQSIETLIPDELRSQHVAQRRAYGAAPTRRRMGQLEVQARRNDGGEVWVAVSLSPLEVGGRRLVIVIARDVTEHRQLQERLRYLGSHDSLTGLYNRCYFDDELARLERGRMTPISLIVIDLDQLKVVNDDDGHAAGDRLLRQLADVLPGVGELDRNHAIERTRRAAIANGVELSIGGATATEPRGVQRALQEADLAMYADKIERRAGGPPRSRPPSDGGD
jgi:PAS domain S-box-containing protein